jgi:hypothetical protein
MAEYSLASEKLRRIKVLMPALKREGWEVLAKMSTNKREKRRGESRWKIGNARKEKHPSSLAWLRSRLLLEDTQ